MKVIEEPDFAKTLIESLQNFYNFILPLILLISFLYIIHLTLNKKKDFNDIENKFDTSMNSKLEESEQIIEEHYTSINLIVEEKLKELVQSSLKQTEQIVASLKDIKEEQTQFNNKLIELQEENVELQRSNQKKEEEIIKLQKKKKSLLDSNLMKNGIITKQDGIIDRYQNKFKKRKNENGA
jgi:glycerol-3-phosphate cytidylyltransferase-like family protein